ncbi:MAG: molybdopterin-dependent oxidoreductase [Nitrospirae bacterium]|nr:molybdopterin-dependent oxidoreductase [Nitrospirota bacterium]
MAKTVSLKINGKEVKAAEGATLLDAAEEAGIHIPNLCYLKGLKGIGACRMCLVEVEGGKGTVPACTAKVKEGMAVNTDTESLKEMRRFVLDLILSMHPLDCMTCTKAGVCRLQQYAYDAEIKESSFTRKYFGYPIDEANPFIKRDPDYCILCARCVRVCKEQGTNVLDFMGRGVGSKVTTAHDKPLQESACTFCGSCVDACPVNALLEADRWRKGREWEYTKTASACLACGNGCDIIISTKDNNIAKINSGADEESVEKYICAIGRFGFDALLSDQRITVPMKRVGNELQETTWEDALSIAAEKLKSAKVKGIISSAGILNEDASALSKLASDVIKTKDIDTTVSLYSDADSMKSSDIVDLDASDLIVLAGLDPSQWQRGLPALDAAVRKRVSRGAKLIVINSAETKAGAVAAVNIIGDEAASLAQLAKSISDKSGKASKDIYALLSGINSTEDSDKAAELFTGAKSPVIFCSPSLFSASRNISILTSANVVAVPFEANARGVIAAGLERKGTSYQDILSGKTDALYVIGETPAAGRPDTKFMVVQTSYWTDLAKEADLILPSTSYLESSGTIVNYLGKIKKVHKAVPPAGDSKQHKEIFADLAEAMGTTLKASKTDVKKALKTKAKAKVSPFEKQSGLDIDPSEFTKSINKSVITGSRLAWLEECLKAAVCQS